jgi:hypothetical protein
MCDPSDQQAGHSDIDHGVGDIHTGFVVPNETPVPGYPSEGSLDHPAAGQVKFSYGLYGEIPFPGCRKAACCTSGASRPATCLGTAIHIVGTHAASCEAA